MTYKDVGYDEVFAAMREYDELGQDEFLEEYGYHPAREYVLVHDGKSYDSKAIVGVAHRYLPGREALKSSEFSGGEATVGRHLRGLGFTVQVGNELTSNRLEQLLAKLQVNWQSGLPALYQPITLLWAFGRARRGDPRLLSWSETEQQVKALLSEFGRPTEGDRVYYPVAALHRAGLWDLDSAPEQVPSAHGSTVPKRWFDEHQPLGGLAEPIYDLIRESPETLAAAVDVLVETYFIGVDSEPLLSALDLGEAEPVSPLEISLEERIAEYKRLCASVDVFWKDRDRRRPTGPASVPVRSQDAKHAVLLRSQGHCESPECTGEIHDVDEAGKPLLEVDHIHDIARGGADDPAQMIALCPNCHTTKTYGQSRERLRAIFLETAEARHRRLS